MAKRNRSKKKKNPAQPQKGGKGRKQVIYRNPPKPKNSFLGDLGMFAGNAVSKIFGLGAYNVSKNSIFESMQRDQVPFMHSSDESIVLRHREFILDLNSSIDFATTRFPINPGLQTTFPWLAGIAQNFREYEFRGLVFEFKSTSATALNSTNTALGTMAMAVQYRADALPFVNKQQLLNEMWSNDAKPSESFVIPVECDPAQRPMKSQYVRGGALSSTADAAIYDLGTLTVASYGSQAPAVVGELWASYEIVLRKPVAATALELFGEGAHIEGNAGVSGSNEFGTGTRTVLYDSLGVTFPTNKSFRLSLGCTGYFLYFIQWVGTTTALTFPTITLTNCTAVITDALGSENNCYTPAGVTSTKMHFMGVIYVPDPSKAATVALSGGTYPSGTPRFALHVAQIPATYS